MLGRKQSSKNSDWIYAWNNCTNIIDRNHIEQLTNQTIARIQSVTRLHGFKRISYAWSGGKDSIVLHDILRKSGIHTVGGIMALYEHEFPEFLEWITDNAPEDVQIASLGTDDMEVIEEFIKSLDGDLDVPGYDEETLAMLVAEGEEVTEQVMQYGVYTPEEVEGVKKYEDEPVKPVQQTYQPPVQRVGMTESQYEEAITTPAPAGEERIQIPMEREQYVICPKCGEKIWLE